MYNLFFLFLNTCPYIFQQEPLFSLYLHLPINHILSHLLYVLHQYLHLVQNILRFEQIYGRV